MLSGSLQNELPEVQSRALKTTTIPLQHVLEFWGAKHLTCQNAMDIQTVHFYQSATVFFLFCRGHQWPPKEVVDSGQLAGGSF